jgi:methylated-DNA-[protein]-cysteine S-methyltransferase
MQFYKILKTPIGELTLISEDEKISELYFKGQIKAGILENASNKKSPVLEEASKQIKDYFDGKLTKFNVPLKPSGTDFQLQVWKVLSKIPYGKTISYGEQATMLGDSKKARAVGGANGKNPIPLIVPCHRVIGKSGALTGFGGGLKIKEYLLDFESAK